MKPLTPSVKLRLIQTSVTFGYMDRTLKCDHSFGKLLSSTLLWCYSFNPLTPIVKPWVIPSFLTFDSMDRTLKCDHSLESCCAVLYCGAVCFLFPVRNFGLDTVRSEKVNEPFIRTGGEGYPESQAFHLTQHDYD